VDVGKDAMRDLSVLIPARNEMWTARTVEDVLAHARADTEVIVVLDGVPADPPLPVNPRVQVIQLGESIGQRAAVDLAARLSSARYVMKLDAHCAVDHGFDSKLIAAARELSEDVAQIPAQYNLHAFNWVCACGETLYQGPTPTTCKCGQPHYTRDVIWHRRKNKLTTAWRFDTEPRFQYWREQQQTQVGSICDVMTSLGACFFMSRERFWQLGGLDEVAGSWGSFGIEVACKSWLSGGRHVVNRDTWFAHMFRTQGGDFSFPYQISASQQERARVRARELWFENTWPGQVRPLSWLIEHFAPIPVWHEKEGAEMLAKVMAAGVAFQGSR
jgi:glycosyltransferase involved in cell wall biosynthesis